MPGLPDLTRRWARTGGVVLAWLALANANLTAQTYSAPPECQPAVIVPAMPDCARPGMPIAPTPAAPAPIAPPAVPPVAPPAAPAPAAAAQPQPQPQQPEQAAPAPPADAGFGGLREAAVGGEYFTGAGYIDSAIPVSQYRLRFDSAYGNNRPDRAEFFYPKCGCFAMIPPGKVVGNAVFDPNAKGPPVFPEKNVDYQDLRNYLEYAVVPQMSFFVDVPVRWINPDANANAVGLSDIQFGGKYAFLYTTDTVLTAQVLANAPSGDPHRGLGTNNWAVEPAILAFQRIGERIYLEAELRDYIPVNSKTDFAGNVLRYGVGASYLIYNTEAFRFAPVLEFVGWTVLGGKELTQDAAGLPLVLDSTGVTIVNAKIGVRIGFGRANDSPVLNKADLYIGYGRALTDERWYQNMLRAEFRYRF
jgi:hypothetical protein